MKNSFILVAMFITASISHAQIDHSEKLWAAAYTICQKVVPASAEACTPGMFSTVQMGPVVFGGRVIYRNGHFTKYFYEVRPLLPHR